MQHASVNGFYDRASFYARYFITRQRRAVALMAIVAVGVTILPNLATSAGAATFGQSAAGASRDRAPGNFRVGSVFTANATGPSTGFQFYAEGGTFDQKFKALVYATDNAGTPTNLIKASNEIVVRRGQAKGLVKVPLTGFEVKSGGRYMLALHVGGPANSNHPRNGYSAYLFHDRIDNGGSWAYDTYPSTSSTWAGLNGKDPRRWSFALEVRTATSPTTSAPTTTAKPTTTTTVKPTTTTTSKPTTSTTAAPTTTTAPPSNIAPNGGPGGTWKLQFNDEFNGSAVDRSKFPECHWATRPGCTGQNVDELQAFRNGNVTVGNGAAHLTAKRESVFVPEQNKTFDYTSGSLATGSWAGKSSTYKMQYGYVEARIKTAPGKGLWSSLWLAPADMVWPPEIDILEAPNFAQNRINTNLHYYTPASGKGQASQSYTGPDFSAGFHTFGLEWTPTTLRWYIDGKLIRTYTDSAKIPQKPMYIVANLSVGGWAGSPAGSAFPATMDIDYIRAWQR